MAFNLFKKKEGVPDVGQEDVYDKKEEEEQKSIKGKIINKVSKLGKGEKKDSEKKSSERAVGSFYGVEDAGEPSETGSKLPVKSISLPRVFDERTKLELDKLSAKVEATDSLFKGFNERFANVSQQIGEIRAMNLSNERDISKMSLEGRKAVDIVKEVKPEKLRIDFQKLDMKVSALGEKLETNKQFMDTVMNEIKDLRKKAGIFIGTDALLRLNEDVKNDLIETQKLSSRVRVNTEKSEELFIELKRGFSEYQKMNELINNFDANYSGLQKEVEKLKVDYSDIVSLEDFNDYKKSINSKLMAIENSLSDVDKIRDENVRLGRLIEKILLIAKKNQEDIADLAVSVGDDRIKRVSDYENQLSSILNIVDTLAGQVSEIKKKLGINEKKIKVDNKKIIGKELKLRHLDVHPEISKPLLKKNLRGVRRKKKVMRKKQEEKNKEDNL